MDIRGKRILLVGMARSGVSAAKLAFSLGAVPVCYDAKSYEELSRDAKELLDTYGFELVSNRNVDIVAKSCDMLVLSPGVPETLPFIKQAYYDKKQVLPEIELGYLCAKGKFVAISGTNGKTTTTALTGEIFKNAGRHTYVLGNIGLPICEHARETKEDDVIVMETAAFQLAPTVDFHPNAAAVLNITEDHMERFHTMEAYAAAKASIFKNQTESDFAVLNYDDGWTRAMGQGIRSNVLYFSRQTEVEQGAYLRGRDIMLRIGDSERYVCSEEQVYIPGKHNLENALAASLLAACMGVPVQAIRETLLTFKGVEHRIEFVCEKDGVRYINDSKGTNPDATLKAVDAMTRPTVLILGGYDKLNDFDQMMVEIAKSNIKEIVVLGATKEKILSSAARAGFSRIHEARDFEGAVKKCSELADAGWNVLLSPACASWDMFDDYEQRGRIFKELVRKL